MRVSALNYITYKISKMANKVANKMPNNKVNYNKVNYNKSITDTPYFKMDDAINSLIDSKTAFIIANERLKKNGETGRYYTVFATFKDFLKQREQFPHCHEILLDHKNSKPNLAGRLVFDFDIEGINDEDEDKRITVPKKFKSQIEDTILEVLEKYFNNLDINRLEFVWLTSKNPKKFSKHLTVKNLYFDNWISMSKTFYQLFSIVWDEKYLWIKAKNLLDFQIVRKNASLRMVGSKKINGYPLVFDDKKYKLCDSLIRIYFKNQRLQEQMVTIDNINSGVFENVLEEPISDNAMQIRIMDLSFGKMVEPTFEKKVYDKAYELHYMLQPGVFTMGKISDNILSLQRNKNNSDGKKIKAKCLLSGKLHENENAFLIVKKEPDVYTVHFGCNRFCNHIKTINIGSFTIDNMMIMLHPNFEPLAEKPKKRKAKKTIEI